jgi:hypothetical protein
MSTVIKVVYCLTRKEGLTREQFQQYWLGKHADLVKARAHTLGMIRYVQSHSYTTPMNDGMANDRGHLEAYDGLMEGWWPSEDVAMVAHTSDAGIKAMRELLDDEGKFIDFSRSPIFMTHEHIIFGAY